MLFQTKAKEPQEDEKGKTISKDKKERIIFKDEKGNVYPTGLKLWLQMGSLFVSMFLVSLVRLR